MNTGLMKLHLLVLCSICLLVGCKRDNDAKVLAADTLEVLPASLDEKTKDYPALIARRWLLVHMYDDNQEQSLPDSLVYVFSDAALKSSKDALSTLAVFENGEKRFELNYRLEGTALVLWDQTLDETKAIGELTDSSLVLSDSFTEFVFVPLR